MLFPDTAFELFGTPVSWNEVVGTLSGALCVWLVVRQVIWNWPVGLLNNVFFFVLFVDAKLYADAGLQIVFFVLGCFGWWVWARGDRASDAARRRTGQLDLPVRRTTRGEWAVLGVVAVVGHAGTTWLLATHTDSPVPFWDALVWVLSLVATYGQARKLVESWWIWIAVDIVSVPLYLSRDLVPTALVYVLFGCMCVVGLRDWRADLRTRGPAFAPA